MSIVRASHLTLGDVRRSLKLESRIEDYPFSEFFDLQPLTEGDREELIRIRQDFYPYLMGERSEGQVTAMTVFPLLRLAGFYGDRVELKIEEGIDRIVIEDDDRTITGRFDIAAFGRNIPFCILVIEAKGGMVEVSTGLPKLLVYAYNNLKRQPCVWGWATNGVRHLFVRLEQGSSSRYQLFPLLSISDTSDLIQLLQVLKAIYQTSFQEMAIADKLS